MPAQVQFDESVLNRRGTISGAYAVIPPSTHFPNLLDSGSSPASPILVDSNSDFKDSDIDVDSSFEIDAEIPPFNFNGKIGSITSDGHKCANMLPVQIMNSLSYLMLKRTHLSRLPMNNLVQCLQESQCLVKNIYRSPPFFQYPPLIQRLFPLPECDSFLDFPSYPQLLARNTIRKILLSLTNFFGSLAIPQTSKRIELSQHIRRKHQIANAQRPRLAVTKTRIPTSALGFGIRLPSNHARGPSSCAQQAPGDQRQRFRGWDHIPKTGSLRSTTGPTASRRSHYGKRPDCSQIYGNGMIEQRGRQLRRR